MRWITALLLLLTPLSFAGCEGAGACARDTVVGGLSERYNSAYHPDERRAAYDSYVEEYVDK